MAETKIYIDDSVDGKLREEAMSRFGYGRGSISKAVEEAIVQWLRRNDRIKRRLAAVTDAAKKEKGIIAVLLFGSYARKEEDYNDIDIAVLLDKDADKRHIVLELVKATGDIEERMFEVSVLNDMPLDARSKILNEAEVLYVSDKPKLYDYSIGVIKNWSDFKGRLLAVLNG
ncbi:MAG: nucleotidyltransferase domain-containing protein [Candidatus Marsarchaeota archaeon]|nr:nucleotidyltransferase domain-containing protein [Candidatus Marsarchaeota archaeon]